MYPGFETVRYFYEINCYTDKDIETYVELGVITKEEYKTITGENYPEVE